MTTVILSPVATALAAKPTQQEAARLMTQATFGPTSSEIKRMTGITNDQWLQGQFAARPVGAYVDLTKKLIDESGGYAKLGNKYFPHCYSDSQGTFYRSFWKFSVDGPDQLRQRVAFTLSQIFVISITDADVCSYPRGYTHYYDMLGEKAFGNYRDLLESVTLHPMMGVFLSHLGNRKENGATTPDENYAREVMQLFSIGLYQLNLDGTLKLGGDGQPIETYSNDDITGLAKVLTGFSWYHPTRSDEDAFRGGGKHVDADWHPMKAYPQLHSTSEKKFLGVTIAAGSTPDAQGDLKTALDTIFNHPNVGPFVAYRLIQRLVTSNPSPAYVGRVATVFNNDGKGVRGDMKAVLTAILMDPEARNAETAKAASYGKVREPLLRATHWMRAFDVRVHKDGVVDPNFGELWEQVDGSLGQTPLRAGSVFNFFQFDYLAPNSATGAANLYAPELQITNTVTNASYANTMQAWIGGSKNLKSSYATEKEAAKAPDQLIERLDLLLMSGQMPAARKAQLRTLIESIKLPASGEAAIDAALLSRVRLALLAVLVSPQYLVQK